MSGDFSQLPEPDEITWNQLQKLALGIEGYKLAPALGLGDCLEFASQRINEFKQTDQWRGDAAELWICLFYEQRASRHAMEDPHGEHLAAIKSLYAALRQQLTMDTSELSQQELLNLPVFIPHRPLKDPRDILMLDPACGSMHFGLYAFDLYERIYEEAWKLRDTLPSQSTGQTLQKDYPSLDDLLLALPKLIIEHNIHGIDIDPRAVQIAGLSLWLRAQKSWKARNIQPQARPRITKSHIVCAEPMPGDETLRHEFIEGLRPRVLGQLVNEVFEKMKLAGEAGSLLKIEEEIKDAVAAAKQQFKATTPKEQKVMLPGIKLPQKPTQLRFDLSDVSDKDFWRNTEQRILDALKKYAEQAENGNTVRRRLFAEDAARGFAFIDLCRKRYDVVLMNPPFGESAANSHYYIDHAFPESKNDIFGGFITRCLSVLTKFGRLGAITNRVGFFNSQFEKWRNIALIGEGKLDTAADLGYGVLDAMVETAAYIVTIGKKNNSATICGLLKAEDKGKTLLSSIESILSDRPSNLYYLVNLDVFRLLAGHPICYWVPEHTLRKLAAHPRFENEKRTAKQGLATADDFRFISAAWEVFPCSLGSHFFFFAKGGEYRPFWDDIHLVINWENDGEEAKAFAGTLYNNSHWSRILKNVDFYFKPGLTYPERTTSDFAPRIFPSGCIFSATGQAIFFESLIEAEAFLGVYISRSFRLLFELFIGSGDAVVSGSAARHYKSGVINAAPVPELKYEIKNVISDSVRQCTNIVIQNFQFNETTRHYFISILINEDNRASIKKLAVNHRININLNALKILENTWKIDKTVSTAYQLYDDDFVVLRDEYGMHPCEYSKNKLQLSKDECLNLWNLSDESLVDLVAKRKGSTRQITKKSFYADRKIELICHYYEVHPQSIISFLNQWSVISKDDLLSEVERNLSYWIGCIFCRWDIRLALDSTLAPPLPDPFDPLPICPPGMLIGPDSLPATPGNIVSEEWLRRRRCVDGRWVVERAETDDWPLTTDRYPLNIPWNGIIVDDENHPDDIIRRVREVLDVIWKDKAGDIEQEACHILEIDGLREYFRKPSGFFADHLKRYSKSRRQAPIYWPLSTPSGSYTLWIYYHRLTDQTLYICVNDFVEPRLKQIAERLDVLRGTERKGSAEKEYEEQVRLEQELREFRDELLRIAAFWKPNLNDGVQITAAPLWQLFRLKPWQKKLKETWDKLEAGDYDWAHLAYSIWPDRVREVCKTDRSIAIAHGLEELCEVEVAKKGKKRGRKKAIDDSTEQV
ncbi:BREX-1 system adenine-specific DNA-methyltransferase PglX [Desulfonatronum parangueonense]